ncbi:MAG: S-adenosylmethionine tRNA ribosyltransferase [Coxiella sp. DG_40]|nr:MAG: S-adenosylmethionine tRNA ribosyltransferase [Coxiella sp. DG_40]
MKTSDFDFNLPQRLIAQYPYSKRTNSRLLCLDKITGAITHKRFVDLPDLLTCKDLLVFNNTKVIPARLFGIKETGGKIEVLIERILDEHRVLAHLKFSKVPKKNSILILENSFEAKILSRENELFELYFQHKDHVLNILERVGHVPLPPYIKRRDENIDKKRYQTVFAKYKGSVAAPTAGLHFDEQLLKKITNKRVEIAFVTLHIGAGTFEPVRSENIYNHKMHSEYVEISPQVCGQIHDTKRRGGRIIAVGTTCVRSLETATQRGEVVPYKGETNIFIYPGYKFHCIDAIITNFHLPRSTLLMLVCAFAGFDNVMNAYKAAVDEQYRFFSYGDAMFLSSFSKEEAFPP